MVCPDSDIKLSKHFSKAYRICNLYALAYSYGALSAIHHANLISFLDYLSVTRHILTFRPWSESGKSVKPDCKS
ncbi:MAG: hypothetical protein EA411_10680 [Saprospirales bacterium]|nr:MAG: hypothetical protein EA411_10680 [Saprospirales bacterium]